MYATHVPWNFTRACMIPCSSRVKCHAWDVPCVFHGILHVKLHVHTLRETWSTQTRDVNLEYLCLVSLRVHACKSEVINERYCISLHVHSYILTLGTQLYGYLPMYMHSYIHAMHMYVMHHVIIQCIVIASSYLILL